MKKTNEAELNHIKLEFLETVPEADKSMMTRILDNRLCTQSSLAVRKCCSGRTRSRQPTFWNSRHFNNVLKTLPVLREETMLVLCEKREVPLWAIKIAFESKEQAKFALEAIMEFQSQESTWPRFGVSYVPVEPFRLTKKNVPAAVPQTPS